LGRGVRHWIACAALALGVVSIANAQTYRTTAGQTCGGYPKVTIGLAPGMCAGLVVPRTRNLRLPRTLAQIPGTDDWLVTDLGGWGTRAGAVWKLDVTPGQPARITRVLNRLSMPHTVAFGPGGLAYVGEMGRIFSFDPRAADPASTIRDVVANLPANELHDDRHPLSAFIFAADGALLVNVGAPSDQCLDAAGKPIAIPCPESAATAVVRRYAAAGPGRWNPAFTVFASGLRNSMAMLPTRAGQIIQIENSIDLPDAGRPFDEINVLEQGRHYGWPYCMDRATVVPAWTAARQMDCAGPAHTAPIILLPPHSAPLGMAWYHGAMFPQLEGKLLVGLHGYREGGARILAYGVDARGLPTGQPLNLTPEWAVRSGVRPRGHPVGVHVGADGAIWVADDKSGVILRLAAEPAR
jgi:glucose/arabinose dehydrogenase